GAQLISPALTLSDGESTVITSATVSISSNYTSGEDLLSFTAANGISGSFNSATGTLTLTGTATLANYQAALDSVTYTDTSGNPTPVGRTISFAASDGVTTSAAATRLVQPQGDLATQLVVTMEPPTVVTANTSFGLSVVIQDAQGNVVTSFNGTVTVALA